MPMTAIAVTSVAGTVGGMVTGQQDRRFRNKLAAQDEKARLRETNLSYKADANDRQLEQNILDEQQRQHEAELEEERRWRDQIIAQDQRRWDAYYQAHSPYWAAGQNAFGQLAGELGVGGRGASLGGLTPPPAPTSAAAASQGAPPLPPGARPAVRPAGAAAGLMTPARGRGQYQSRFGGPPRREFTVPAQRGGMGAPDLFQLAQMAGRGGPTAPPPIRQLPAGFAPGPAINYGRPV